MTQDEEKLEAQIAAQEAADPVAAEEAAAIPDQADAREGYPPPIEEPAHMPDDDQSEPETVDEKGQPDTGLMEDMAIQLIRLTNGEWILGQFKVVQDGGGNTMMAFNKAFRFNMVPNQQGQMQPQIAPWPVTAGTIELHEISATGFTSYGWDGLNLEGLYQEIVSPVAIANRRQAAEEIAKKNRADAILSAGKQGGRGPRR